MRLCSDLWRSLICSGRRTVTFVGNYPSMQRTHTFIVITDHLRFGNYYEKIVCCTRNIKSYFHVCFVPFVPLRCHNLFLSFHFLLPLWHHLHKHTTVIMPDTPYPAGVYPSTCSATAGQSGHVHTYVPVSWAYSIHIVLYFLPTVGSVHPGHNTYTSAKV